MKRGSDRGDRDAAGSDRQAPCPPRRNRSAPPISRWPSLAPCRQEDRRPLIRFGPTRAAGRRGGHASTGLRFGTCCRRPRCERHRSAGRAGAFREQPPGSQGCGDAISEARGRPRCLPMIAAERIGRVVRSESEAGDAEIADGWWWGFCPRTTPEGSVHAHAESCRGLEGYVAAGGPQAAPGARNRAGRPGSGDEQPAGATAPVVPADRHDRAALP